jgi:cytochrome c peroxidase
MSARTNVLLACLCWALCAVATPPRLAAAADLTAAERAALAEQARAIFGGLPSEVVSESNPSSPAKIDLGRMLYFDSRLSKNHDVSCNSCHDLATYGQDNQPTSPGHRGQRGGRSSPSVYHAALHISQFWDGRAANVEEQAKGPILNPIEMAMPDEESVLTVLRSIPGYAKPFARSFPEDSDPITYDNLARAIGAFERRLMTPSPFDDFLSGKSGALDSEELRGLQAFVTAGCVTCHLGPAVGGASYQKLGLVLPYATGDAGRFDVTALEADRHVFKVPSLRNVAKTAPYFHDGSIATLSEAIRTMARHQLGKELNDDRVAAIQAFLGSLTGRIDAKYTAAPILPPSGPQTPAPDSS